MKNKLLIIYTALLLFVGFSAKAQDLTNYNLYSQNPFLYNPAYSVDKCKVTAFLNSHLQWSDFEGAPKVNTLGLRGNISENSGLGITVFNFKSGVISTTDVNLNYAYKAKFGEEHFLLMGLGLGIIADKVITEDVFAQDMSDPVLIGDNAKQTAINSKFGLAYINKKLEVQVMFPQLTQRGEFNFYTVGILGYKMNLNEDFMLKPSVMVRGNKTTPKQFDLNLAAHFKDMVWLSAGYRSNKSMFFGVGANFSNYALGYAYQTEMSDIQDAGKATHEIQLIARFGCKQKEKKETVIEPKIIKVTGNVIDKQTGEPLTAHVVITNTNTGEIVFDKEVTGKFETDLGIGNYTAAFTGNIIPKTEKFEIKESTNKNFKLEVKSIKTLDKTFNLGSVNFETSKSVIKDQASYNVLDQLVEVMNEYPELKIEIQGHTDSDGSDEANLKLSQDRADVCKKYAIDKGINASRLTSVGYGETKPIVNNDTPANKAKNRRTEFKIVD